MFPIYYTTKKLKKLTIFNCIQICTKNYFSKYIKILPNKSGFF